MLAKKKITVKLYDLLESFRACESGKSCLTTDFTRYMY